jgi:NAD(P)H dehydrogenase (quinone)
MRVFIVHAHPEPSSFNGALTRNATQALVQAHHAVVVSDLYAMRFDPVSDRRNFVTVGDAARLRQQVEEDYASRHDGFAPELQAEMDKLDWCDVLVFQFPLWWLGLPAILKGWVDRVFAVGRAYGGGRYFSRGIFAGKRAMCSVTIGGSAGAYSDMGAYGPLEHILYPIQHGMLAFVGFDVIEPFVVHEPARVTPRQRADLLQRYRARMLALDKAPTAPPLNVAAFDALVRRDAAGERLLGQAAASSRLRN